jgi:hypothetical protein
MEPPLLVADIDGGSCCSFVVVMDKMLMRGTFWWGLLQGYNYQSIPAE